MTDLAAIKAELRALLEKAPDGPPWIRLWESLDVHGIRGDGVLTRQRNIDLAVAAVNALPALLADTPSVEPAGLDVEEQGAGLRAALLVQANKPDLTERFAEGVRFAADFVGAWLSSADDDPAKRLFLVVRPIDGAPEVRDGDLLLRRAYENGHREGFGCGQETVAPLGIAKCEHVGG